jgi:D-lactate dehydrogenase (cytochrome)
VVLSTRAFRRIGLASRNSIEAGAGVPLVELQRSLAASRLHYPPVPTYDGACIGGTIATNAAGAATFKYGSTRAWIDAITVILASGEVLDIVRGDVTASSDGHVTIESASGNTTLVPMPRYTMPDVAKLSAGYYSSHGMDLIDLFIGSEGTLGIVTAATLRVIPRRRRSLALIRCDDDHQAVALTASLRVDARAAWEGRGPLDIAAIEYMDAGALRAVADDVFARAGVSRPGDRTVMLLVQIETDDDEDAALQRLQAVLAGCHICEDPVVSPAGDDRGAQHLLDLREAVPAGVNARVAAAKAAVHPDIEKTAGDMVVPFDRLADSLALYRRAFESRSLDYAIWGHVSDGNLHPNVIPRSLDDVERGREAILEIAHGVIAMGGAPLAEHGVGRSALKQRLLRELYGDDGIEQMRAVKQALDPEWKLAPGVLFSRSGT